MHVVVIREKDGSLNVVGPFWHENEATRFYDSLPDDTNAEITPVTDREKFRRD